MFQEVVAKYQELQKKKEKKKEAEEDWFPKEEE